MKNIKWTKHGLHRWNTRFSDEKHWSIVLATAKPPSKKLRRKIKQSWIYTRKPPKGEFDYKYLITSDNILFVLTRESVIVTVMRFE